MLPPSVLKAVPPKRMAYGLPYGLSANILGLQKTPTLPEFPIPDHRGVKWFSDEITVHPTCRQGKKPAAHRDGNEEPAE